MYIPAKEGHPGRSPDPDRTQKMFCLSVTASPTVLEHKEHDMTAEEQPLLIIDDNICSTC